MEPIKVLKANQEAQINDVININTNPKTFLDGKPQFGYILTEQKVQTLNGNFFTETRKVAIISGRIEHLVNLVKQYDLKEGSTIPEELAFRIVTKESTEPFYQGQQPKINPSTSEILTKDGKYIYRVNLLVGKDSDEKDELIQHDRRNVNQVVQQSKLKEEDLLF
jgi:hypothetical protein